LQKLFFSQADLAFSTSFTQLVGSLTFSCDHLIHTIQPPKRVTVTGIEITHSSQNFLFTTNDVVTPPDVEFDDMVVVKNWVPKIEQTVEMGRNIIANTASVFIT
jgi:hypothetical protein